MKKFILFIITVCLALNISAHQRNVNDTLFFKRQSSDEKSITTDNILRSSNTIFHEGFEGTVFPPHGWTTFTTIIGEYIEEREWHRSTVNWNDVRPIGFASAASRSWYPDPINGFEPNNWLMTCQISLPAGSNYELSWMVRPEVDRSPNPSFGADKYSVYISTTGNTVADFTTVLFTETFTIPYNELPPFWKKQYVNLSDYAGQNIYVAFRHHDCEDESAVIIDDIKIDVIYDNDLSAVSITGPIKTNIGTTYSFVVKVRNAGVNTASGYSVRLMCESTQISVQSGTALDYNEAEFFTFFWTPEVDGVFDMFGEVIFSNDQNEVNNVTATLSVNVFSEDTVVVFIGDPDSIPYITANPFDFFWKSGVAQTIYYDSDIQTEGFITHLEYYFQNYNVPDDKPIKIWMANVSTDFMEHPSNATEAWLPHELFTLVYDGLFPQGQLQQINDIFIPLDTPFHYLGENLVIKTSRIFDPDDENYDSRNLYPRQVSNYFRSFNRSSDIFGAINPEAPTGGGRNQNVPNVRMFIYTASMGDGITISGTVVASDTNQPLPAASVALFGNQNYGPVTSNAEGFFILPNVLENETYTLEISAINYITTTHIVTVENESLNLGNVLIYKIAYPPNNLQIVAIENPIFVDLEWEPPLNIVPQSYNIYRAPEIEFHDIDTWILLATDITVTNFRDDTWAYLNGGVYRFIVTAIYANNNESEPAFSNRIDHVPIGWVVIGDPETITENTSTPYDYNWARNVSQFIFLDSEIPLIGFITEIVFEFNGNESLEEHIHELYIGKTEKEVFADNSDWESFDSFTLAWSGSLPKNIFGWHDVQIVLDFPFFYDGGNIVIMTHRPFNNSLNQNENKWRHRDSEGTKTLYIQSDDLGEYDFSNLPPASPPISTRPDIKMKFYIDNMGSLTGTISCSISSMPLEGVEIKISGTNYSTFSNELGNYLFTFLPTGETYFTAQRHGYHTVDFIFDIAAETNHYDFEMIPLPLPTSEVTITLDTGNALPNGAIVTLGSYEEIASLNTVIFTSVPFDTYLLSVEHQGFKPYSDDVVVSEEKHNFIVILDPIQEDNEELPPQATTLKGNYPNPFNPSTIIAFDIKEAGLVQIDIFNIRGQKIKSLVNEHKDAGRYTTVWTGIDDAGRSVSSGMYFYQMKIGGFSDIKKMVLMK